MRMSNVVLSAAFAGRLISAQEPPKPCPAEGYSGGFSHVCPQKQFANPSDISAMMAALPDKPLRRPLRFVMYSYSAKLRASFIRLFHSHPKWLSISATKQAPG